VLVDLIGVKETVAALERAKLLVPAVLLREPSAPLFVEPHVDVGRFFVG
jgi:hypothetical protein